MWAEHCSSLPGQGPHTTSGKNTFFEAKIGSHIRDSERKSDYASGNLQEFGVKAEEEDENPVTPPMRLAQEQASELQSSLPTTSIFPHSPSLGMLEGLQFSLLREHLWSSEILKRDFSLFFQ